jgi:aspartate/methionine/tyrosine aminotransferase
MAYTPDLGNKAQVNRHDLHAEKAGVHGQYGLDIEDLDRAYAELGDRFRILLLTQPNNPTGQVFSAEQLERFADWCIERRIHLVVNEIYLFSRFDQSHPVLRELLFGDEEIEFQSFLPILDRYQSPFLHWWYAISKDFGLSGLRLGFAYTCNEDLLKAWGNYGAPSMASNHTQWMLAEAFGDTEWTTDFVSRSQASLTESYATVIQALEGKVRYSTAVGSLFVWFDLGTFLKADTLAAEQELWRRIYDETDILLTAPDGIGSPERGWFRLVHSCVPLDHLQVAMQRFSEWLNKNA